MKNIRTASFMLLAFFLMPASSTMMAAPVYPSQARQVAQAFLREKGKTVNAIDMPHKGRAMAKQANAVYYVFNNGENDGFVIVSGDDRTEQVLGYSLDGHFDGGNIPENLKWVLDGYERQISHLQEVCSDIGVACLGYLPKTDALKQDSRYLGLDFSKATETQQLVRLLESHVDWRRLCSPAVSGVQCKIFFPALGKNFPCAGKKMWIARNAESFSFLYQEFVDQYPQATFFDPEKDIPVLDDADWLFLPGGYPEKHLEALVANAACRKAIKDFAERGGHIQAECGGMMYLCRNILTDDGDYPMCDVLPYTITARQADRKLSLGYRSFELDGSVYRGHEFHYTQFQGEAPHSVTQVYNAKGIPVGTPVMKYKNVLASYTHLYPHQR